MKCQACSFEMPDNATFCPECGSSIGAATPPPPYGQPGEQQYAPPPPPPYGQPGEQQYAPPPPPPYGQPGEQQYAPPPYAPDGMPVKPLKNGWLIAAIVVAALTMNVISLVLSIVALLLYDKYRTGVRLNNFSQADYYRQLVRNLGIIAWVVIAFGAVARVLSIVLFILFSYGVASGIGDEFYYEFAEGLMYVSQLASPFLM